MSTASTSFSSAKANFRVISRVRLFHKSAGKTGFWLILLCFVLFNSTTISLAQSGKSSPVSIGASTPSETKVPQSSNPILTIPQDSITSLGIWIPSPVLPGIASMPLYGDRSKSGFFVLRVKYPNGLTLLPHSHPNVISTMVLSGMLCIGEGEKWDDKKLKKILPGQTYTFEPGAPHFEFFVGETVLQIHGIGPMLTRFLDSTSKPLFLPVKP
ncbi:MAG: cupin domain-containing protein [Chloroherpetonaceae bacterium]|nr:cupin domain-containing protein [Chloroherpetonaceae bacterium]